MSHGVLQQVGTPFEVYNSPTNGFVASFVGENNRFGGTVLSSDSGDAKFATDLGTFSARIGPRVGPGTDARVYVRPEHCRLEDLPAATMNSVPVTVREIAFEGNFLYVHVVDAQGGGHIVQMRNDTAVSPPDVGARKHLVFAPEHTVVLADAALRNRG